MLTGSRIGARSASSAGTVAAELHGGKGFVSRSFRLLIIEDQPADAELMVAELVRSGFGPDWTRVDTLDAMLAALDPPPGVILCDYSLPGLDAPTVLARLHEMHLEVPVIVVSGQMDEETCVKSLRLGAVDYLLKDRLARLGPAVDHALATRRLTAEKREAERRERETAAILAGLVDHSPAAISVKAVDGRYLLANRQFERLCGLAPDTLAGKIDAEIFPAEKAREMTELDARCLHTSIVVEREEEFPGSDGSRNLLCVRYPISDENGEIFGIGAIYTEITRQKRVESDLRAARADIMSRAEKLAAGNNQLREIDRMKTDFVAAVSHELRNPLTSVRGYVEMLRDRDLDPELNQKFLDIIDRNSANVLSLVEDLQVLSKMESGHAGSGQFRAVSFPDLVEASVATVEPAARQAGMTLKVKIAERLPVVLGDASQLERVLVNLLSNAVKFSPPPTGNRPLGGRADVIDLEVSAGPGGVRLEVRDRGIGIPQGEQARLFTRFFRSNSVIERGIPGTGLGLAVVKGVVDAHRGTIRVDSAPGRGTTMTVELPGQR
ncbi:hybrid sensor histidine kinase/response regulator [Kineosporia sp. NBRC 101677]|nr:hybrid sensor histidine kinase/response regulator [Kineosporia sp. NBRC 101677]